MAVNVEVQNDVIEVTPQERQAAVEVVGGTVVVGGGDGDVVLEILTVFDNIQCKQIDVKVLQLLRQQIAGAVRNDLNHFWSPPLKTIGLASLQHSNSKQLPVRYRTDQPSSCS